MTEDTYRTIGSLIGLGLGFGLMIALGFAGIIPGAIFGAGGCVTGAIAAEKIYKWNNSRGK